MMDRRANLNLAEVQVDFRKLRFNFIIHFSNMSASYEEIKDFAYELAERVRSIHLIELMYRLPRSSWRDQLLDGLIPIMPRLRRIRSM